MSLSTNLARNVARNLGDVLVRGFDQKEEYTPVKPSHFIPYNHFVSSIIVFEDSEYGFDRKDTVLIDKSNGDEYIDTPSGFKRDTCLILMVATPIIHAIGLMINLGNRVVKTVILAHFWYASHDDTFKDRLRELGWDLLTIALTPIIYVGLELASIYGLILPYDGGKLYATLERVAYGRALLAPCFQPYPTTHLSGANIADVNTL